MSLEFETADLSKHPSSASMNDDTNALQVSGVTFGEQRKTSFSSSRNRGGVIINLLTKTGLVKDERSANFILSILVVIIFTVTGMLLLRGSESSDAPQKDFSKIEQFLP
jgi:formate-dependent nitrite reductase membrane component NrfD